MYFYLLINFHDLTIDTMNVA